MVIKQSAQLFGSVLAIQLLFQLNKRNYSLFSDIFKELQLLVLSSELLQPAVAVNVPFIAVILQQRHLGESNVQKSAFEESEYLLRTYTAA